jgi:hypothetical protein
VDDNASTGSDNASIQFDIVVEYRLATTDVNSKRFNWNEIDWDIFCNTLNTLFHSLQMDWQYLHEQPTEC